MNTSQFSVPQGQGCGTLGLGVPQSCTVLQGLGVPQGQSVPRGQGVYLRIVIDLRIIV